MGEGVGDWGYAINCPATVLRSCRYCRIEDIITSGEQTSKYELHDFEVSEALITCPKDQTRITIMPKGAKRIIF